jgi:hypothetical protein
MSSVSAVSASRVNADLFAAASAPAESSSEGKLARIAIDDCGSVPHVFKFPPPPPPPEVVFERFANVTLPTPTRVFDDWCGTVPHKLPFPPPPPPPFAEGMNQFVTR